MNIRRSLATVGAAGALTAGSLFLASPAQVGPLVVLPTGGALVDVNIIDFAERQRRGRGGPASDRGRGERLRHD